VKSGKASSRDAAKSIVVWVIDRALARKKTKLTPPNDPVS